MYTRVLGSFQEQDVAAAKESYSKQGYSDFSETVLPSGKISLEGKKSIDLNKLRAEVNKRVYSHQYHISYDSETIAAAKEVARENKVKYQDILKGMRPRGTIDCNVWDENGNICSHKKIFGR